jgi:LacI family transcriptional regulator/LacI family asc operon transcriptional repressor
MMNIYDVSKKAGVSIATVSRVLNGNMNVSEKTRAKVLSAMKELDYTPNIFARGLGLNTMKTIGIMCSDSSDTYLANAVYYIEQELRKHDYDSILCCTGHDPAVKSKYLNLLMSKRVDGIILVGSQFVLNEPGSKNSYIINAAKELPIVLVNGYLPGNNIYSVLCRDKDAVYQATSQLIEHGHSDIVYLYTSTSYSGMNKLEGYTTAMKDHGLTKGSEYQHLCTKSIQRAREYLNQLYEKGIHFDAVVTSDDSLAVGAVKFAYEHNISIPDELEIIGYNNSVLANCTEPELSSIDSKVEQLSIKAVDILMQVLCGNSVPSENTIAADIIKRNTTKF